MGAKDKGIFMLTTQREIENHLYWLVEAQKVLALNKSMEIVRGLGLMLQDYHGKIEGHRKRGEWL